MKKVSAILCSDLHIQENTPVCRLDNYMQTMGRKFKWLRELQEKYNVPILCGGDLYDYWKPSPWLLAWSLRNIPNNIITIAGQHDLPAHSLEHIDRSGIQVLADAGKITLISNPNKDFYTIGKHEVVGFPWGVSWDMQCDSPKIAIIHYGVYEDKPHYPGAEKSGGTAKSVMKKLNDFDLILSGDNHLSFSCKMGNQVLINPGSFLRTTASQIDHKPSVYLWYAETNEVERVYVPIESGVISREHIDQIVERDERIEAFLSKVNCDIEISISFKNNMKNYLASNEIVPSIKKLIWEVMQ